ncbi:MAG TPA: S-adenosylmethionine:tRNA ribosyltransferase-isomerase, partial [Acidimicrobiales bacterium]|nr:S-adenosylmethionine:tRNA ribosyltransferase-isomerase [Acidimicrobiales bacterium]
MDMAAFDYELPESAIAQVPAEPRDAARLLVATDRGEVRHARVADLPELLGPGDLLVMNDSRVLPARLLLRKETGGAVEVLLLEPVANGAEGRKGREGWWEALVRPGRRVPPGTVLMEGEEGARAAVEVGPAPAGASDGRRMVRLLDERLPERVGSVALPPYVHRPLPDPERYQTVYASRPGSVAAPTAGLHLTH